MSTARHRARRQQRRARHMLVTSNRNRLHGSTGGKHVPFSEPGTVRIYAGLTNTTTMDVDGNVELHGGDASVFG